MALFTVAAFLMFLIQCLRLFDSLAERGQSLLTLLGQALLGMPALGTGFLYVCLGIGLGRALRSLDGSTELQMLHVNRLLPTLLRSVGAYIVGGALLLLVLAHIVNPLCQQALDGWSSSIAADLVSRSMVPGKIIEIADGVSITIGARDGAGNITGFFADDHRKPAARRTYFAKSAIITRDAQGYVLRMENGAIQEMTTSLSEVSFVRYDLPLDALTGSPGAATDSLNQTPSTALIAASLTGDAPDGTLDALARRSLEALRVIAICLFVAALAAFPSGRRRTGIIPIELAVLGAAFIERGVTSYLAPPGAGGVLLGVALLVVLAAAIILARMRLFSSPRPRAAV
jgi:lipopolysaccharide export system permease protein